MSDDPALPPFIYDGLYPAEDKRSAIRSFAGLVSGAVKQVSHAVEAGRKPGMPLDVLSDITRVAPLSSLMVAFVLGAAVARRR
ncbi:hypothetical protein SSBR45G_15910 [Bradyrhizobium sp. SSBR45G]|uniref:hypothetical protein n=1 Tax=unclassified Bradyrhizobium TaxID=2631580 RepID=UPI0023428D60|nr:MULTISPECIES: hypothetical protein [unclassified Bradyrhizobium]GLH76683.1 hypothetical protein SSBR45G_15910 [Bradyrhizobium sp. SSBR45G]GLH84296.1 hypothetical protein SSBR45R_17560 [Bradyrhizobium sp. SSBR45R]